jgi:GntR family transcriptional regulator
MLREIKIDKYSVIPAYYQLQDALEDLIENGRWKPDELLPSENELSRALGLSRATVQRALKYLVDRGLAYRIQGKGTFVANKRITSSLVASLSFSAEMIGMQKSVQTKLLAKDEIPAPETISRMLNVSVDEPVYRIQRLRYVDEIPISLQTSYLAPRLVPDLIAKNVEEKSLFALIKEWYNLEICDASETLQAVKANKYEAKLLSINEGDAVFLLERVSRIQTGETLEFVKTILRGDKSKFYVELTSKTSEHGVTL